MRRLLLLTLLLFGSSSWAADYPLWGKLTAGNHAIGFTARFEYDHSRTFRAKFDVDGKPVTGNRARPIQIAIWYPARTGSTKFMKYDEYTHLVGQELEFGPLTEQIINAGRQQFATQRRNFSSASQAAIDQLLQTKTAAVKDATAASGKFPLIVYAPGASGTAIENPVFCEFLASHGYIVAALPSLGAYARTATIDLTGFYAHMQDIEFVIGYMKQFPNVDPDRLALAGFSMGGSASTLVQMRNFDIDAVVYLDTGIIFPIVESWFRPSNYYNPSDLRAAQLYLTRADAPDINVNFLDSIPYADTYSLLFPEGYRHVDFISDGIFTGVIPGYLPEKVKNAQQLFEFISQHSLQFLDAYVKKDAEALTYLKKKPQEWGVSSSFVSVEFKPAAKAPPREWEFANLIREGGFDRAKAIYEEQTRVNPKASIFRENVINALGYEFFFQGNREQAIKILTLNVEAFPQSANAHDSLSEVYEAAGKKELALQIAEKGIALVAQDASLEGPRRELIKRLLEDRVKKLKGM